MANQNIKVCIVAQNASLKYGGEAALPWLCFKYLRRKGVDAHLVAHGRTKPEILAGFPGEEDRLHFAPETKLDRALWKMGTFLPGKIDAQTFGTARHIVNQRNQRKIVARLIAEKGIQIVHEINPVSPKQVSLMRGLRVPVVIGPLAGGMTYPPAFGYLEPRGARAVEISGRAISHFLNMVLSGKRSAAGLIVANQQARDALPGGVKGKIFVVPDVGVDLEVWKGESAEIGSRESLGSDLAKPGSRAINGSQSGENSKEGNPVRFIYLGRLADWKGVQFLLDAFAIVLKETSDVRLDILGDGEERKALEEQAGRLNLGDRINFVGWVKADEGARRLRSADVFVLPSLHEVGGIVLLEAMAVGLPIVATNWGGPASHVSDETGIRVDPVSREGFVRGLADAMLRLARSPELRKQMGAAGIARVGTNFYDWNQKVDRFIEIYAELIAANH
jgi:glycosyltransferase involved in cell wall biosynthesis